MKSADFWGICLVDDVLMARGVGFDENASHVGAAAANTARAAIQRKSMVV